MPETAARGVYAAQAALLADRRAVCPTSRDHQGDPSPHPSPFVRDPSCGRRRRSPCRSSDAGTRRHRHHRGVHARHRDTPPEHVPAPSACMSSLRAPCPTLRCVLTRVIALAAIEWASGCAHPGGPQPTTLLPSPVSSSPARPSQLPPASIWGAMCVAHGALPDPGCKVRRHVTASIHRRAFTDYGLSPGQPRGAFEVDHLIPLELGGDNTIGNLWSEAAEPRPDRGRLVVDLARPRRLGPLGLSSTAPPRDSSRPRRLWRAGSSRPGPSRESPAVENRAADLGAERERDRTSMRRRDLR